MRNYVDVNVNYWEKGYNAPNVESYVFRANAYYFKSHGINIDNTTKILDFGCGGGSNVLYFDKFNADTYGVDISTIDIERAKSLAKHPENFKVIEPTPQEDDLFFDCQFDIIMANQSLYYLSNSDMHKRLISLNKMLKPSGVVFFTMISVLNAYYKKAEYFKDGLYRVVRDSAELRKRHNRVTMDDHYVNFTHNTTELVDRFNLFQCIHTGYYDQDFTGESGHHYMFFGKKKDTFQ